MTSKKTPQIHQEGQGFAEGGLVKTHLKQRGKQSAPLPTGMESPFCSPRAQKFANRNAPGEFSPIPGKSKPENGGSPDGSRVTAFHVYDLPQSL